MRSLGRDDYSARVGGGGGATSGGGLLRSGKFSLRARGKKEGRRGYGARGVVVGLSRGAFYSSGF